MAEQVYFTGASLTFSDRYKLVHGQQGEVIGPGTGSGRLKAASAEDRGVSVKFPSGVGIVGCFLTELSRQSPVRSEFYSYVSRGCDFVDMCSHELTVGQSVLVPF